MKRRLTNPFDTLMPLHHPTCATLSAPISTRFHVSCSDTALARHHSRERMGCSRTGDGMADTRSSV